MTGKPKIGQLEKIFTPRPRSRLGGNFPSQRPKFGDTVIGAFTQVLAKRSKSFSLIESAANLDLLRSKRLFRIQWRTVLFVPDNARFASPSKGIWALRFSRSWQRIPTNHQEVHATLYELGDAEIENAMIALGSRL